MGGKSNFLEGVIVMTGISEVPKVNSEYAKSVIKAMFLVSDGQIYETLEQAMDAYERVSKRFSVEEIDALGRLYDKENPITFAGIISSNYKIVQLVFLEKIGESKDDLEPLSDQELKDLIVEKILDEQYRKRAEKLFFIQQ
ncbi:hypothetical protein ACIQXW_16200 [Lysinibacillus sp. NPDC097162]|uniref:hypothetical protein n=2 Tax=Lysinibacillus TaxID=400634 RepID=UPI00380AAA6A